MAVLAVRRFADKMRGWKGEAVKPAAGNIYIEIKNGR